MFHQVRIASDDSEAVRFLWWQKGDLKTEPQEYRMVVYLFGATSSPSCACYALSRTAMDHKEEYKEATIETVLNNFYVDDC